MMESVKEKPLDGSIIACPDCDLLQRVPVLPPGGRARCCRCRHILMTNKVSSIERTLALSIAAFIFLLIANLQPLLGLSAFGRHTSTTVFGSVLVMWERGYEITAVLIGFCGLLAPAVYIVFMVAINLAALYPPAPWWIGILVHWAARQQNWSMLEVMMLGILISLIKLSDIATIIPGVGMYAVGLLIILLTLIKISFDSDTIWQRIRWAHPSRPLGPAHAETFPSTGRIS
ncbi:MAG: paraquat-inducible protein A [Syntrophales bacterium]|jgi:paraquat-inducible protein A